MAGPQERATIVSLPADDVTVVFRTELSRVHGRLVRLGGVADRIIGAHGLPDPASLLLGEGVALAGLLGSALQGDGSVSIQTQTNGVVPQIYADCEAPGKLRGYARVDGEIAQTAAGAVPLGHGHLAFTIDQNGRYQGVIGLDGQTLQAAARDYFEQREALPTFLRLAAAQNFISSADAEKRGRHWRAGGLMLQPLGAARSEKDADDDGWRRVLMLAETLEDHELLDPTLSAERLLLRLFHEEGVIIEKTVALSTYCKCSRERIVNVLRTFGAGELADLRDENGNVDVKCEFCATSYEIGLDELDGAPKSP